MADLVTSCLPRTVRENLRVVLTVSSLGPRFQRRCREFPALANTVSIILLPHWSKEALVAHAYHLLKGAYKLSGKVMTSQNYIFELMVLFSCSERPI